MAIQPPVIQTGYDIPPQPQDPPSSQDVVNAGIYAHRVELAYAMGGTAAPSVDAVAEAHKFHHSVTAANAAEAAAPPWFHTAMRELTKRLEDRMVTFEGRMEERLGRFEGRMEERLGRVEDRLGRIEDRLGSVEDRLGSVEGRLVSVEERLIITEISVKVAENAKRGDGITQSYVAVPNARGDYPDSQGLTALTNANQIKALSTADADRYIAFYSRPGQQAAARGLEGKKQFIANAIGCTVPLFLAT